MLLQDLWGSTSRFWAKPKGQCFWANPKGQYNFCLVSISVSHFVSVCLSLSLSLHVCVSHNHIQKHSHIESNHYWMRNACLFGGFHEGVPMYQFQTPRWEWTRLQIVLAPSYLLFLSLLVFLRVIQQADPALLCLDDWPTYSVNIVNGCITSLSLGVSQNSKF